jgi:hypothetical protein
MALPCLPKVQIRLGTGVAFGVSLKLGDLTEGILGTNILGLGSAGGADISHLVQQISIRRGRDRIFANFSPGQATIRFQDFTGDWNPENTAGPYYGQILPMRQVKITTEYLSVEYPLYTGFVQSWDWNWPDQAADYAIVTVQCVDAFRLLALSNFTTLTGAAAGDLPGARIGQILNEVDWPSTLTDLGTGDTPLEADSGNQRAALSAIQTVEHSDLGAFFIDGTGTATYLSRADLAIRATQTPVVFSDEGTNVDYQELDVNLDDTDLANQVTIGRSGGTPQTVSDSQSISDYFLRSFAETALVMETDLIALSRANAILNYRKVPRIRVDSITLDLSSVSNRVIPGLSLDIGDPITVNRDMAAGTDFDKTITVNGISHDITPGRWKTTFSTAYPLSQAFILGNSEFGILGTSTL